MPPPLPAMDLYYHTVKSPELEPFGTVDEDVEYEDEDKQGEKDEEEEDRDRDYVSVLPKHHHTFDEDDYFFSKTSGPQFTDEHYNEAETDSDEEEKAKPEKKQEKNMTPLFLTAATNMYLDTTVTKFLQNDISVTKFLESANDVTVTKFLDTTVTKFLNEHADAVTKFLY